METSLFCYLFLMTCIGADVAHENTQGNFPLQDCKETNIQVISLLVDSVNISWEEQYYLVGDLNYEFVKSALWNGVGVVDQLNAHTRTSNFSNWISENGFSVFQAYMGGSATRLEITRNVSTVLELKIEYVENLFEEISALLTDMAVRVGILFLDGTSFTYEQIRNVSSIVEQRKAADVKIFVVIVGNKLVEEIVLLFDTIVFPDMELGKFGQTLLMAMCNLCMKYWFSLQQKTSIDTLSCYRIPPYPVLESWTSKSKFCSIDYHSYLATIETEEELLFLRKRAYKVLERLHNSIISFHIGLRRDVSNYAKRFQWETTPGRYRPLLINHWLPGKPSKRFANNDCGVWRFTNSWAHNNDNPDVLTNITKVDSSEGWTDVHCQEEIFSLSICETILPRRITDIIPDPTENCTFKFQKGFALSYQGHIVSVSANVANRNFLQFLRDTKQDFPVFDCGEDVGDDRYISYSMVCDFVDHCRNKRDELSCVNPRELHLEDAVLCASGQRLRSTEYICDNVKDCRDGSDEDNCMAGNCNSVTCHDGSCLPLQWINDGHFDCIIYDNSDTSYLVSDENHLANVFLQNNRGCTLICNRDTCIKESWLNDGVIHCRGSEGPLDETIGALKPARTCRNTFGQFIWAPKCHYIKYRYGGIIGCRDMSHLRKCKNFQCGHGYVKCYNSYCIPRHYIRDGKADCPTGEDEQLFYTGPCTGYYFACWDSTICLHPDLVCNGRPDCPHDDDELDCHEFCPEGFRCVAGTVMPSNYNSSVFSKPDLSDLDIRTRYLDLSGAEIQLVTSFSDTSLLNDIPFNLKVLIMSKCTIKSLYIPKRKRDGKKTPPFMIQKLDISYNIFAIFSNADYNYFYKHINYLNLSYNPELRLLTNLRFNLLEILDLSHTSISYLNDSVFAALSRLMHLNLSHTLISDFTGLYFDSRRTLQILDLRGILTKDFHDYLFHGLTISQTLYTDHFEICCPKTQGLIIASHACISSVDADAISSCFNLLGLSIQRYLLWIVASLAVLGNVTVIVYRVIWDRSVLKTGFGLFVTNLGISDFIMGVYLFIIAGADYFFRDHYVLYDKSWRASDVCKMAGFMACLSCEASTFFVFLITLDRFLVMKFPFGQMKCSKFIKISAVVMSWVASFLLAVIPIVFSFDIYSSNAMCIGLPLTNTQAKGWIYSVVVFIIFNIIMFLFIAYGQYAIFRAMSENRISKTTGNIPRSRRVEDITVAKQLSLVVFSNFLFWFPVGLMGLMSLGGHGVSSEVYGWTTVLLLPINSAANPILYTIPALIAKWERFKTGDLRTLSSSL